MKLVARGLVVLLLALSLYPITPCSAAGQRLSGEVLSVDHDVQRMVVRTRNPFTGRESTLLLVWSRDVPGEERLLAAKPGDRIRVSTTLDSWGRHLVRKAVALREATQED
ncbi:MAG: hypothetical protein MOGMAGMI_00701 [Candidatus Omnitrophica bacterium]|nr:hypothetical protein [Candidatus Omnitrophota bacterium]